jgi:AraC-like DNA-binding protein
MAQTPYVIPMPAGIPTFSQRFGHYIWKPGTAPVLLLHNDFDIFWVTRGQATWELRDGSALVASKDQFAILPPYVASMIHESRPTLNFWYCHFSFRLVAPRLTPELKSDCIGPGAQALVPLTFTRREAPEVWSAYRALTRVNLKETNVPWRIERSILNLVTALAVFARRRTLARRPGRLFEPASQQDPRIAELCSRINLNPEKQWRVAELAESVGLSAGRLHALCTRVLGKNLKTYIIDARLQRALKLLKEHPEGYRPSIKEVSAQCGFSSQHLFSRQFKAAFRISPIAYRNGATLA